MGVEPLTKGRCCAGWTRTLLATFSWRLPEACTLHGAPPLPYTYHADSTLTLRTLAHAPPSISKVHDVHERAEPRPAAGDGTLSGRYDHPGAPVVRRGGSQTARFSWRS